MFGLTQLVWRIFDDKPFFKKGTRSCHPKYKNYKYIRTYENICSKIHSLPIIKQIRYFDSKYFGRFLIKLGFKPRMGDEYWDICRCGSKRFVVAGIYLECQNEKCVCHKLMAG